MNRAMDRAMDRRRRYLGIALLSTAFTLLVYYLSVVGNLAIGALLRGIGATAFRTLSLGAAIVSTIGLLVIYVIIAVPITLAPAPWWRKVLHSVPLFILIVTLACTILYLNGIGATGSIIGVSGFGGISWGAASIGLGVLASTIAIVAVVFLMHLSQRQTNLAIGIMSIAIVPNFLMWLGMTVMVVLIMTNEPTIFTDSLTFNTGGAPPGGRFGPGFSGDRTLEQPGNRGRIDFRGTSANDTTTVYSTQLALSGALVSIFAAVAFVSVIAGLNVKPGSRSQGSANAVNSTELLKPSELSNLSHVVVKTNYTREVGRSVLSFAIIGVAVLAASQLVQVSHANPPAQSAVVWDSTQTQQLWARACADCHSNETRWPWYASIAPVSWLMTAYMNEGRRNFNISEADIVTLYRRRQFVNESVLQISAGTMPPVDYLLLHPDARLAADENQRLVQGLVNTLVK